MKKVFLFAALVAGVMSIASCNKEQNPLTEEGKVTITVSFPEVVESKVAMEEGQQALDLKWENDDKITVVGNTTEVFTVASISEDGKTAVFTGNAVAGDKFDVILSDRGVDYLTRSITGDYAQSANGKADGLTYDAVLKGVNTYENVAFSAEWAEEHGGTFAETGCLMFNIQVPEGCTEVTEVKLLASDRLFNSTNKEDNEKAFWRTTSVKWTLNPAEPLKVYFMTSMFADVFCPSSQISVLLEGKTYTFIKDVTFTKETRILPGKRNVITLNGSGWMKTQIKYSSDAGLRQTWNAPYANTCNTIYGPGFILDGTNSEWHLSSGDQGYIVDSSYDEWYTNQSGNLRFKAPMVGIVNLGKAEYIQHMYIQLSRCGDKYSTGRVEVYLSNDESNDAELGDHLNQNLTTGLTNEMVDGDWAKWSAKRWVKYADIPVTKKYIDVWPGHYKAKYIMLVLHSTQAWPYLNLQAINPKVYAKVD